MGDFKFEVWPTEYREISQHFGINRQNYAQFGLPGHDGVDIKAPAGSKVFCVAPGEVYRVHVRPTGHNYGIHVRVSHRDGYRTVYAHLQKALVRRGQIVETGELLGLADSTGNSFGAHLHLTLKQTKNESGWPYEIIDPTPFLLPLLGWREPAGPYVDGWMLTDAIVIVGKLAQVNIGGATLYINNNMKTLVPAGTMVIVVRGQEPFTRVRVSRAAVGMRYIRSPRPAPEPPPIITTVDGWAWKPFLIVVGKQAIVGSHGNNLRAGPERSAVNIGMIKSGSTVSIRGALNGRYLPVRVRRNDLMEPVYLPDPPPNPRVIPPEDGYMGWVLTQYLSPIGAYQALTSRLGVDLRNGSDESSKNIGLVKAFATVSIAGATRNGYTPVLTRKEDVLNAVEPMPDIEVPERQPDGEPIDTPPRPAPDTVPGWAFTNGLQISGNRAKVTQYGSNLRAAPRRDAKKLGYIPPDADLTVTGPPQGEYTPVRVANRLLELPTDGQDDSDLDSQTLGRARIGLHASADPKISEAEHQEFADMRPGMIKVLSFHSATDIGRLAAAHPDAHWIVRAFFPFGGQSIRPGRFLNDTISDVRRALAMLNGRQVVVELHNEPNTVSEGLGSSWSDGTTFAVWWLELLKNYRLALPGVRFIYPGLSPGSSAIGLKQDHVQFIEASRAAVEAADGLGVHIFWSDIFPMSQGLNILDDYISRFRARPIWVTEASYNRGEIRPSRMAQEYLHFWRELQTRPVVQGVTYFGASASNPELEVQTWVSEGIGKLVGKR